MKRPKSCAFCLIVVGFWLPVQAKAGGQTGTIRGTIDKPAGVKSVGDQGEPRRHGQPGTP